MKSFNVDTQGRTEIKTLIKKLFEANVGPSKFTCEDQKNNYDFLQCIVKPESGEAIPGVGIYHNPTAWQPDRFPVLSLMDAITELTTKTRKEIIILNSEYGAAIVEGQNFVTVGCQKIPVKAIRALNEKLDEFNL